MIVKRNTHWYITTFNLNCSVIIEWQSLQIPWYDMIPKSASDNTW